MRPLAGLVLTVVLAAGCRDDAKAGAARETTRYADLRSGLEARRRVLAAEYQAARSVVAKRRVLTRAAGALRRALEDELLPAWDGTKWAFGGTTQTPGEGEIACGYFVSTTLSHAGLRVERAPLGRQAAEAIIKTLVPDDQITRYSDVPVLEFARQVAARGDGLYIVGLDNHVGYLLVRGDEVLFHHSSYVGEARVTREPAVTSAPLASSGYRVVGKLFMDPALLEAWLTGAEIPTKH